MKKQRFKTLIVAILLLATSFLPLYSQQMIDLLEFYDQPITDILLALGKIKNVSIITDETVGGTATYSFVNIDVDRAMEIFLSTHNLYMTVDQEIYYISKIRTDYNSVTERISMDAVQVNIQFLISAISKALDKTIHTDPLPALALDIHADNVEPKELLQLLIVRAPDYKLEVNPNYFYVKRDEPVKTPTPPDQKIDVPDTTNYIRKNGALYTINQNKKRFLELINELFYKEKKEYSMLLKRDTIIETIRFENKTFDQLLALILEQANADYTVTNDIYYIFEIQQRDILKIYKKTEYIQLHYISPQDIQRIMPPELGTSKFYRIDLNSGSIILNGSEKEIAPIRDFIRSVDRPLAGNKYFRYDLNFIKAGNIKNFLPNKYKQREIITIPESNAIIVLLSPEGKKYMDEFLRMLDREKQTTEIVLKYIKAEDLMKNLPPSVNKEDIIQTMDPSIIFFSGTPEKQEAFKKQLAIFDQPVPQIRYHVFVLANSTANSLDWSRGDMPFSLGNYSESSGNVTGKLGKLLNIDFDVVSSLGLSFAAQLNLSLGTEDSQVMADTVLNALSGQKVSFDDTTVARYATVETPAEGGSTTFGPTREVKTGLVVDLEGWVSGENMVSMEVSIKLSDQGSSANPDSGDLGSTHEKNYTTTVRTRSGEIFKVGGLMKETERINETKWPILGDIPGLEFIFKDTKKSKAQSEILVYILPYIVKSDIELADTGRRITDYYNKYFK